MHLLRGTCGVCSGDEVKIVAHRGASAVAPENTMSAFRRAVEAGADAIELDVQATADERLVVLHDATLDLTTDATGALFETDWATIEGVDAGSWFSPDYIGERVPTLEDVLSLDHVDLELELKGYGTEFLEGVIGAVRAADALARVEFTARLGVRAPRGGNRVHIWGRRGSRVCRRPDPEHQRTPSSSRTRCPRERCRHHRGRAACSASGR